MMDIDEILEKSRARIEEIYSLDEGIAPPDKETFAVDMESYSGNAIGQVDEPIAKHVQRNKAKNNEVEDVDAENDARRKKQRTGFEDESANDKFEKQSIPEKKPKVPDQFKTDIKFDGGIESKIKDYDSDYKLNENPEKVKGFEAMGFGSQELKTSQKPTEEPDDIKAKLDRVAESIKYGVIN
jgi:hypothetical protein